MKTIFRPIRQSLSRKISFGLLLMAIPVFMASMGILYVESRRHVKNEAVEHAVSALESAAQRVERHLNTVETACNSNSWLVTDRPEPEALLDLSRRVVFLNGNIDGCSISMEPNTIPNMPGYFSAYTVRQDDSLITVREDGYKYYEKEWYLEPLKRDSAIWLDPFLDSDEGPIVIPEMIVSYNQPLKDQQGKSIGVFSCDLSLSKLAKVIQQDRPYKNAYFMLLGKDGHYYVHPDAERLMDQTIFDFGDAQAHPDITALGHEMTTGHKGAMQVTINGKRCLVCYQPVPGTQWSLALVCSDRDILHYYNRLALILAPLIIIGLLLILLLCNRIVAYMMMPLKVLLKQSKHIAEGNYDEKIDHTDRKDAVGELQNSFALMQESLNERMNDIKRMNTETAQRNVELMEANRLAEESSHQKTAFIQNMTHQIRTPLNIVMGFAQVMRDSIRLLPEEEVDVITTTMYRNAIKLNRMMMMLYDSSETGYFEEIENLTFEPVRCNEAIQEGISSTLEFFPNLHVNLVNTLPDSFIINTNRLYLVRCLRELLCNSAKYANDEQVTLRVSESNSKVRFVIEDIGPGIDKDYRNRMFTPFYKVNDLSEGLGLGLPLTKRHANCLGGDLLFDADYTKGCRFILELPIA